MQKLHKRKSEGFTIVETLIVLAIVGVMMIVVFLAVPALNRSSHNSGYKTDANNLLAAVSEYAGNNGGVLPTDQTSTDNVKSSANTKSITVLNFGGANPAAAPTITYGVTASSTVANLSSAVLVTGVKCTATNSGMLTKTGAGTRSFSIVYAIETTGTPTLQCIDS